MSKKLFKSVEKCGLWFSVPYLSETILYHLYRCGRPFIPLLGKPVLLAEKEQKRYMFSVLTGGHVVVKQLFQTLVCEVRLVVDSVQKREKREESFNCSFHTYTVMTNIKLPLLGGRGWWSNKEALQTLTLFSCMVESTMQTI